MFALLRPPVLDSPARKEIRSWDRVPVQAQVFCQNAEGEATTSEAFMRITRCFLIIGKGRFQ
jgi:hypothetical protein